MSTAHLLLELGTEELPPTALKSLSDSFTESVINGLIDAQLTSADAVETAQPFASPRRLAILVPEVQDKQPDQTEDRRGPAVAAAFDEDGNPTPAAQGFARSCGVEVTQLSRLKTDKGEWLSYAVEQAGKPLADVVGEILEMAVKRLPIPKRMRWGDADAEFVRPVHWLVAMHGNAVLPTSILGLTAGNRSRGHRFHSEGEIEFTDAKLYQSTLREAGDVIASFSERQQIISTQIEQLADSINATIDEDQDLLDEVTALVEKPVSLLGDFDSSFLEVPSECLISAMRDHQKYFHLRDAQGNLLPNFITVSNIESSNTTRVIAGNERVLRARLSDARFFWDTDRKQKLATQLPKLENVLFHVKLGSLANKTTRLMTLAEEIAGQINAEATIARRGAELCKADLITDMVGEFDKLQGVMGHYYADLDGEPSLVGQCIEQHYWPRFSGDQLPESAEAQAVALADRLDSLVGIYAAGEVPTGDKDPYSLRRASLGILRILIEQKKPLSLVDLVTKCADAYAAQDFFISAESQQEIVGFIQSRLTAYYQAQGIATSAINAVAACKPERPLDFDQRLAAVRSFNEMTEAADLVAANKRITNILKKQQGEVPLDIKDELLLEPAEQALFKAMLTLEGSANQLFDAGDYSTGLKSLAELRSPVDEFFENVMVMSDDPAQQTNRLALLKRLQALFLRVADIGQLQA